MAYVKQVWENLPSTNTPLSADRLNHMEDGIYKANEELIEVHNSYSTSTTDSYSCNYVNGVAGKILWTNPNPTSDFSPQTITLSSDDYDILEFFWRSDVAGKRVYSTRTLKGSSVQNDIYSTVIPTRAWRRRADFVSNTSYSIDNCIRMEYNQTAYNDNGYCVPLYVIGYKTGLFS